MTFRNPEYLKMSVTYSYSYMSAVRCVYLYLYKENIITSSTVDKQKPPRKIR